MLTFTAPSALQANGKSEAPSKKDIVSVALEAGSFKTLATALTEAGLVSALQGEGPFTVFAPTDAAFAKLPAGTLEKLLADKEALKEILLYHVVKGNVSSSQVVKLDKATTLAGKDVRIAIKGGKVMINSSEVTTADVSASNGVIHVIDEVLIPSSAKAAKSMSSKGGCN
ncbi:MAG: fasciclin domain-containing protein [Bacteroidota bacterium]|nr:fasciclin domain-containing protein [Bacteroidota bacterium]